MARRRFRKLAARGAGVVELQTPFQILLVWCSEGGYNSVIGVLTVTRIVTAQYAKKKSTKTGMLSWPRLFLSEIRADYKRKLQEARVNRTRMPRFPQERYFVQGDLHFVDGAAFRPSQEHSTGGSSSCCVVFGLWRVCWGAVGWVVADNSD